MDQMLIVRATKKLLRLAGPATAGGDELGTTLLGSWYATVLFWRPRVVLLVNESTLLPVLMPLAPTATLTARMGIEIVEVLAAHHTARTVIATEQQHMRSVRLGATINRSTTGIMTEFTRLAQAHHDNDPGLKLPNLALQLADTPCSPLYGGNITPGKELAARLRSFRDS